MRGEKQILALWRRLLQLPSQRVVVMDNTARVLWVRPAEILWVASQ